MEKHENVWIRVAGNARMIREGGAFPWRCYLGRREPEIPLREWSLEGRATRENVVQQTSLTHAETSLGLAAWIDFYGDAAIEDGKLRIELKKPA